MDREKPAASSGAVFLIADEDMEASDRMTGLLSPEHFYVSVRTGEDALRYFGGMRLAGTLLSDAISFDGGGAGLVLDRLVEGGARVVILMEECDLGAAAKWRERGAFACLLHPTKSLRRLVPLREVLERLAALFRDSKAT